jgi:hypothetical protein
MGFIADQFLNLSFLLAYGDEKKSVTENIFFIENYLVYFLFFKTASKSLHLWVPLPKHPDLIQETFKSLLLFNFTN